MFIREIQIMYLRCFYVISSAGMSQFVNPGDEINFEASRQLCHNHTLSLAGIMAIDEEYFRLNGPSWIDILRYRVESAAFNGKLPINFIVSLIILILYT